RLAQPCRRPIRISSFRNCQIYLDGYFSFCSGDCDVLARPATGPWFDGGWPCPPMLGLGLSSLFVSRRDSPHLLLEPDRRHYRFTSDSSADLDVGCRAGLLERPNLRSWSCNNSTHWVCHLQ